MKIGVINGPNLNLLGVREPDIYGTTTLADIESTLEKTFKEDHFTFYQSNVEGEIINALQSFSKTVDFMVINAAAYTHTSIGIADAIASISTPVIEVHLSNIFAREDYRHVSLLGKHCAGSISGFGAKSYELAVRAGKDLMSK